MTCPTRNNEWLTSPREVKTMASFKKELRELADFVAEAKALKVRKTSNPQNLQFKLQAGRNRLEQLGNTFIFLHEQRLVQQTEKDARLKTTCLMVVMFNLLRIEFSRNRNNKYVPIEEQMKHFPREQFNKVCQTVWPKFIALNSWFKQFDRKQLRGNAQAILKRDDVPEV